MSARSTSRRHPVARLGVLGLVALTSLGLMVTPASAAPGVTIPVDPAEVAVSLRPIGNVGNVSWVDPHTPQPPSMQSFPEEAGIYPMPLAYDGVVRLALPPRVHAEDLVALLELAPSTGADETRTYSSDSTDPAEQLVLTDRGNGEYDVDIPVDDGVSGPVARLTFSGLGAGVDSGVLPLDDLTYHFRLTTTLNSFISAVTPQLVADARVPCGRGADTACLVPTVAAGSTVTLRVPATSRLHAVGLGDLGSPYRWGSVQALDDEGVPRVPVTFQAQSDVQGTDLVFTVPQGTPAGRYAYTLSLGVDFFEGAVEPSALSVTVVDFEVTAALNAGLRSDTGWEESAAESGLSPLVAVGGGMVLAAGLVTALVLRPRRRAAQR